MLSQGAIWLQSAAEETINLLKLDATGILFAWYSQRWTHFCIDLSDGNDNLDARLQDSTSATVPGALFWVFNFHLQADHDGPASLARSTFNARLAEGIGVG